MGYLMNDDDDLFGYFEREHDAHTRTRSTDPWTSHAAVEAILDTLTAKQDKVYDIFRGYPDGLTLWALEEIMDDHGSTWRTRVSELVEKRKLLKNSGITRQEPASPNPTARRVVWICNDYLDGFVQRAAPITGKGHPPARQAASEGNVKCQTSSASQPSQAQATFSPSSNTTPEGVDFSAWNGE